MRPDNRVASVSNQVEGVEIGDRIVFPVPRHKLKPIVRSGQSHQLTRGLRPKAASKVRTVPDITSFQKDDRLLSARRVLLDNDVPPVNESVRRLDESLSIPVAATPIMVEQPKLTEGPEGEDEEEGEEDGEKDIEQQRTRCTSNFISKVIHFFSNLSNDEKTREETEEEEEEEEKGEEAKIAHAPARYDVTIEDLDYAAPQFESNNENIKCPEPLPISRSKGKHRHSGRLTDRQNFEFSRRRSFAKLIQTLKS